MISKELLAKVKEAINEPIVGEYVFETHEIEEIYEFVGNLIKSSGPFDNDQKTIVFIALVNISKEWESNESSFLDFLYKKFSSNCFYFPTFYNNLREIITSLFNSKQIYMIEWGKKYYATLCSHALAPVSSTKSFFDMCWEIYTQDLDEQYEENDPVFDIIAASLAKKFGVKEELENQITIGSQIYSMRVGLKGLALYAPKALKYLLEETISTINAFFNNNPVSNNKYSHILLREWWDKKLLSFGERRNERFEKRERMAKKYSDIRPKYVLKDDYVALVIPPIRLLDNIDVKPSIDFSVDGEILYRGDMDINGSGVLMATLQKEFEITEIYTNILNARVVIRHCNNVIYDSGKSLFREMIIFKNGKEVPGLDFIPGFYDAFFGDFNSLLRTPHNIQKQCNKIYTFEAKEGEVIQSNNKTIFFFKEQRNKEFHFFMKKKNGVVFRKNGKDYEVIDGELYIDVDINTEVNDVGVRYEDATFKLAEFPYQIIDDKKRFEITSLLNVGETQQIKIFKFSSNQPISETNIIKFMNIQISFDKPFYYGDKDSGVVFFKTDKYFKKEAFNSSEEIKIPLEDGEIIVSAPYIRWKIGDNEWNSSPLKNELWYEEISNNTILTIDAPVNISFSIVLSNNCFLPHTDNLLSYNLGAILNYNSFETKALDVFIKIDNKTFLSLFKVSFFNHFCSLPYVIFHNEYKIGWFPETFVGNKDSTFSIRISKGNKVFCYFSEGLKSRIFDCTSLFEGKYQMDVFLELNGKSKELYSETIYFGDFKQIKYMDKSMKLTRALLMKSPPSIVQIRPLFIENIKYLGMLDGFDYYSGDLLLINKDGEKIYLNRMRDSNGNIVKINPLRLEMKTDYSCYIGYGLDLCDDGFEYDDEFCLDFDRKITIDNKTNGLKNFPIDYFLFELKNN